MESSALRAGILKEIDAFQRSETSLFLEDSVIASTLNVPVADVQTQLDILEHRGLVRLANNFQAYGARLTPAGLEELEALGS